MARKKANRRPQKVNTARQAQAETTVSKHYINQMKERFWIMLNYLTVPFASAVIFGFTAFCEYVLFWLVWSMLSKDIQSSQIIAAIAGWAQIAIACTSLIGMMIHSAYSLYNTYLVERQFAEQGT